MLFSRKVVVALLLLSYILSVYCSDSSEPDSNDMPHKDDDKLCPKCCEKCNSDDGISVVYVGGTALAIGTVTVVAAPVAISLLGFTSGGIAAGSCAASMMSTLAPTAAGGVVATFQSLGAAGMTIAAKGAVFSAGAAVGGSVSALWQWANEDWGFSEFVYRSPRGGPYVAHESWLAYYHVYV